MTGNGRGGAARFIAALLLVILLPLCAACRGERTDPPITVNGAAVDAGVFRYYYDRAAADPANADRSRRIEAATAGCVEYVTVNSAFAERSLRLTGAERAAVSEAVNALWQIFGSHYEKVGVTKAALYKLKTAEAMREALRSALFGTGGEAEVPEETLREWFSSRYLVLKWLRVPLTAADVYGNRRALTDEEREALLKTLSDAAVRVNAGAGPELVFASLAAAGEAPEQQLSAEPVQIGDPAYPAALYAAVEKIEPGRAAVCLLPDDAWLVIRSDPLSDPVWFSDCRAACLKAVSEPALSAEISAESALLKVVRSRAAAERIAEEIDRERGGK